MAAMKVGVSDVVGWLYYDEAGAFHADDDDITESFGVQIDVRAERTVLYKSNIVRSRMLARRIVWWMYIRDKYVAVYWRRELSVVAE